ncbi:tryptophan synthase subunit alpha [Patescibacteria group bacterium]|nr:tryptophan synthase subunit alpha [Patescibacteria group bacterium]MBU1683072.1 tryptophan synthase subunit alpha [Patescibacteria group bacterium]
MDEPIKKHKPIDLMTHLVAGYPSLKASEELALVMSKAGADILEIQIPFSDPIADGHVIAEANAKALQQGVKVSDCLKMIGRLSKKVSTPIFIMTYFNVVFHFGVDKFCKLASEKNVQGLIIPDYPFDEEESNGLIASCKNHSLSFVPVLAPNTRPDRMREVLKQGSGFVYCVARVGTTGSKTTIDKKTIQYLKNVRKLSNIPVAVGFGLSEKVQMKAIEPYADIAVIGTALIKQYKDRPLQKGKKAVREFLGGLF